MKIELTHNTADVGRIVGLVFSDQVPHATANAINDTAKDAQKVQRAHQRSIFDVKRPVWVDRAVKIKPFATKQRAEARISIDPPGGKADVLGQHEADIRKTPIQGGHIATPTENVPRTAAGVVRTSWRPGRLKKRSFRGGFRTFVRQTPRGRAIFSDESSFGGGIVALYWLDRSVPLHQDLDFVHNVITTALRTYPGNFVKRFDQSIRGAR